MESMIIGFGLIFLGAACGGSFGLPSKFAKADTPWEVLWGPFFLIATILIPCIVAPLVVNDLGGVYGQVKTETIVMVLLFGLLWGLGSMTLGMSFSFIGLSLAYALNYGAQIACGFLLPILIFTPGQLATKHGGLFLGGVAVCLIGVVVSGRAGILKEKSLSAGATEAPVEGETSKQPKILIGLIIGVVSGVLCACYAVASQYAGPIGSAAVGPTGAEINAPWAAAWAVTAMILWGGAVSSCSYCAIQLTKNKTLGHFAKPGVGLVLLLAATMAVLHDAAIFFFGLAWLTLGDNMAVGYGYPVFMAFAIIVGNFHGFRSGEWKGASRQSVTWIIAGIALLIVGVCIIATGKSLM